MRILLVHNYYLQPGGEDTVFESDASLLRAKGHDVFEYIEKNEDIATMSQGAVAVKTIWSQASYKKMKRTIAEFDPDIVQFYNTFPLISPSAYYACKSVNVPVIQYLFNPRLICPSAKLYRNQKLCVDCIGRIPAWPGIVHGCYHDSHLHTLIVSSMTAFHHMIKTWDKAVDVYLSATEFYRGLYIKGGLPPEKIIIKPNYISDASGIPAQVSKGEYALFVARLDPEKGVKTMLNAWKSLSIPLKIRGNGQLEQAMRDFVLLNNMSNIDFVDRLDTNQLANLRKKARFLIWPSEGYYETFGLVAVECFAQGIPVIASNIGVLSEIVKDGKTGLLFNPGDSDELVEKVKWLWTHPEESKRMGQNARREYEEKYTAERNYQMLMDIYQKVIDNKK